MSYNQPGIENALQSILSNALLSFEMDLHPEKKNSFFVVISSSILS